MGFSIEDGNGSGRQARVNKEHHLETHSVTVSEQQHINAVENQLYSMVFNDGSAATAGVDDSLLYIKNSSDLDLVIYCISLGSDTANFWYLKTGVTATAVTGGNITAVVPTNLNAGSGNAAEGTFLTDDGDTMLLTGGAEITRWVQAADAQRTQEFPGTIILKKNDTFGLFKKTTGADTFLGHVCFGYHEAA